MRTVLYLNSSEQEGVAAMERNPTEADARLCEPIVKSWRKRPESGNRYKGDVADSWALACLQKLETFEVAPPRLADRREFILRGGDCICLDWWDIHSDMGSDTKPSQGFERRLKTNAELCGTSVRWSWCKLDGEYYLVRSP